MSTDPTGLRATPLASGTGAARTRVRAHGSGIPDHGVDRTPRDSPAADAAPPSAPPARGRHAGPVPRRKRKVRKVHRVVRHVEVWSMAKVAAIFVACGYLVVLISGYLLWRAADRVGTIDGIEGFMEDSGGYDTFQIFGDVVFQVAAVVLAVLAVVTVAMVVLAGVLFNLISDVTGGIRMTVIDEDLIVAPARRPPSSSSRRTGPPGPGAGPVATGIRLVRP